MDLNEFQDLFTKLTDFKKNQFHTLVWISGEPKIGDNVSIGFFSEINAKESQVTIGDNCAR